MEQPRHVPDELRRKIEDLLGVFEAELIPHDRGTPCPMSVAVPMRTPCDFYKDRTGTQMVCKHCNGCGAHCSCWDDDDNDYGDGVMEAKVGIHVIQPDPPRDGDAWDCQCARCGSDLDHETCDVCGGDGVDGHECGEDCCCCLDPEENVVCDACGGRGSFPRCLSSAKWCEANPLPGREAVKRGQVEWFHKGDR